MVESVILHKVGRRNIVNPAFIPRSEKLCQLKPWDRFLPLISYSLLELFCLRTGLGSRVLQTRI